MDLGLRDHVVCITGGGSGIGEAITRLCVDEGARPVIVSRNTPAVEALRADLQQAGTAVEFFEAELGEPESCEGRKCHPRNHRIIG